jgi:hypothetical protein
MLHDLVQRAPVSPTDTTSASALTQISLALMAGLTGLSAAAGLFGRGLQLEFDHHGSISVPNLTMPSAVGFVAEGQPIPALQGQTSVGATLNPRKLAAIWVLTFEQIRSGGEAVIRQTMLEKTAQALDTLLFDSTAGDSTRPPGLLNGVAALPATTGGGLNALLGDIKQLVGAVEAVSSGGIVFIMRPAQAANMSLLAPGDFIYPVLPSTGIPVGTLIAISVGSLASATSLAPDILASRQAEYVRDTAPTTIDDAKTAPMQQVGSLVQTDEIGFRLTWDLAWGLRASGSTAWVQNCTW